MSYKVSSNSDVRDIIFVGDATDDVITPRVTHFDVYVDVARPEMSARVNVESVGAVVVIEPNDVTNLFAEGQLVFGEDLVQGLEGGLQTDVAFLNLCCRMPELEGEVLSLVACLQKGVDLLADLLVLQVDDAVVQRSVC